MQRFWMGFAKGAGKCDFWRVHHNSYFDDDLNFAIMTDYE